MDAITEYRIASETGDMDRLAATLTPDVELPSPLSGNLVFRGPDDICLLLGLVFGGTVQGLRWVEEIRGPDSTVLVGIGRVGPLKIADAMLLELAGDGRIRRIRPHLRPWLATTLFGLMLGPRAARHPGMLLRALRAGASSR